LQADVGTTLSPALVAAGRAMLRRFGAVTEVAVDERLAALVAHNPLVLPPVHAVADDGTVLIGWARLSHLDALAEACGASLGQHGAGGVLLAAWRRWGDDLPDRLLGEFSLVVHDPRRPGLWAAIDPFGVRPLFHRRIGQSTAVSDSLHVLRDLPGPALTLDEDALGDVTVMRFATDSAATIYRQVRRLPPGHLAHLADGQVTASRYWRPEGAVSPLIYRDDRDYGAHFTALFDEAVADRIVPGAPARILLSAGMDSTSVAASAARHLGGDAPRLLSAHTAVNDAYRQAEGDLARRTAEHLGIAHHDYDNTQIISGALPTGEVLVPSQPGIIPALTSMLQTAMPLAATGGTLLTGMGGDLIFSVYAPTVPDTIRADGWRAPVTLARHLALRRRLPPLGLHYLRRRLMRRQLPDLPLIIDRQFARRTHLLERLTHYAATLPDDAARKAASPFWGPILSAGATSESGLSLEVAHPFFDRRLLEFARQLPPGLLLDKRLLRLAMAARLPPEVVAMPKTTLGHTPVIERRLPQVQERHLALLDRQPALAARLFDLDNLRRSIRAPQPHNAMGLSNAEAVLWWLNQTDMWPAPPQIE